MRTRSIISRKNFRRRITALSFVATFMVIGVGLAAFSHAATNATLSVSPATGNVSIGSTVTVSIVENSSTVPVNAVQAYLTYDQSLLQFDSISTSTSPFTVSAQAVGGAGAVSIGSGSTTPLTGQQTLATVTFTALTSGSATIGVASTSQILESSDSANILSGTLNGVLTLADTTPPSVPTAVKSLTSTATSISLTWTASTDNIGVTGYKIYRGGTQVGTSTSVAYTDTGLAPSNSYSYTVTAYDAAGNVSGQSTAAVLMTTPDTTAPSVPIGLSSPSNTDVSISLAWTASTDNVGVTGYKIYRGGTQVGTSTTAKYTDATVSPNTSYIYTIAAYDAAGNVSAQSAQSTFKSAADTAPPSAPTGLSASEKSTTSVSLTWTASTDNIHTTGYNVYRNGTKIGTSATNTYTDTTAVANIAYSYAVAAYDEAGNVSPQSTAQSITLKDTTGDINGDNIVNITDLSIQLSNWEKTGQTWATGDLNGDGVVNITDLSLLLANWGK